MDSNLFGHIKVWAAQILLTLLSEFFRWPWLEILAVLGGIVSIAYTIYKWHWSAKFNKAKWEITQDELRRIEERSKKIK
jgi:hypothetical protein